ncbi:hypothetical protein GCM10027049_01400 [Mucilaginibacter puniceus]
MKKLLFLFMLMGVASLVRAQAKFELKPFNKLPESFYKKYNFTLPDSLTRLMPQTPSKVNPQMIDSTKPNLNRQYAYNPMPVVRMEGRSNMPIVKMQGNSKMPVINPDAGVARIITRQLP